MQKRGLIIYREAYGDEDKWTTAMHFLYQRATETLEATIGPQCYDIDEIWRRAYGNEEKWTTAMHVYCQQAKAARESTNRPQLDVDESGRKLEWTVVEDFAILHNARKDTVRQYHQRWLLQASEQDRGGPLPESWTDQVESEAAESRLLPSYDLFKGRELGIPRYDYCVYIDDDALDAIIAHKDDTRPLSEGYIILIKAYWTSHDPFGEDNPGWDGDIGDGEDPIEGCERYDVGWMRYRSRELPWLCISMHMTGIWDIEYDRPPQLSPLI
ncbi:hypothetical protein Slin15195_G020710 [Septoria linicola]|uniref:Uncharacterized protein n=1 Tax=Septoria linicola TaxID=215465 RepID=A0A9Q9EGF7_9PEZI|nr:hypothetical protein Slin14017_G020780 [Septoria linicola]USW48752.1 hypothetical protein Slin15195_G020710 [Septoria linicola]